MPQHAGLLQSQTQFGLVILIVIHVEELVCVRGDYG